MAEFDEALKTHLGTVSSLTALVGDRIHPDELPERKRFPLLVYKEITLVPMYSQEGDSNLTRTRVQFDAYASTRAEARAILVLLRTEFSGKRWYAVGVQVQSGFIAGSPRSEFDEGLKAWRAGIDYEFAYRL